MSPLDRSASEASFDDDGVLSCSLCERDVLDDGDHVFITWGNTVIQVACRGCAQRFREIFRLTLAAARSVSRQERTRQERQLELEEETRG